MLLIISCKKTTIRSRIKLYLMNSTDALTRISFLAEKQKKSEEGTSDECLLKRLFFTNRRRITSATARISTAAACGNTSSRIPVIIHLTSPSKCTFTIRPAVSRVAIHMATIDTCPRIVERSFLNSFFIFPIIN
ncbi:Uncharacterised protein [Chryseobacterium carnipullorum]|uniref:Uncharacterized protein n=1 Tax=Chryseobacterium carnipullorum TaxID=1124835 RepID=A0A376EQA9_CHRCU|nr:Uncharacterised protein [Chryseobacterium carnipullorum]